MSQLKIRESGVLNRVNQHKGLYIVFEGPDGAGKSTAIKQISQILKQQHPAINFQVTRHPGETKLGEIIRNITKYPQKWSIPALGAFEQQLLMMTDYSSFVNEKLIPGLNDSIVFLSDRHNLISSLVYGKAGNLSLVTYDLLYQLINPPRADLMFVFNCDYETLRKRIKVRNELVDDFEKKGGNYLNSVIDGYSSLITESPEQAVMVDRVVPLDCIVSIDASCTTVEIQRQVLPRIEQLLV